MKKSSKIDGSKPVCSSWLSSEEEVESSAPRTDETAASSVGGCSTSTDSSARHTPILAHHVQATSTPCPPKSQPPARTSKDTKISSIEDLINDETGMTVISNDEYNENGEDSRTVVAAPTQTLANNPVQTTASLVAATKSSQDDEDDDEYQVPSNLDINNTSTRV